MKKLSVLAPLKIVNQKDYNSFLRCLESYIGIIKLEDTELLIINESNPSYKEKVEQQISKIKSNYRIIEAKGFVPSVRKLISESVGDYIIFFLDDVEIIGDSEKIYESCVQAMDMEEKIFQIKFGGGKVSHTTKNQNIEKYSKTHKELKINQNFSIWLNPSIEEYKNNNYVITHWNCITRGKDLRTFNSKLNKNPNTWDELTLVMSSSFKKDISGLYTGWLNLQSFLYAWGRNKKSYQDYKKYVYL
jgi:hypothetical protein